MCSITGVQKGCIGFWGRFDQNSGFHGNRKPPLTYYGENDVSTFSRLFMIRSLLYLQITRTCIQFRTSSNFGSSFIFDRIIIKVAGNQDRHKSSDDFDFGPDKATLELLALE